MLLANNSGGSADKLYVNDVFSTFLYDGNGSTQTINNGINLAGKGGLVWIKRRDDTTNHLLFDTARGATYFMPSNTTWQSQASVSSLTAFNANGFSLGADTNGIGVNGASASQISWTFRKEPKFFDVVTYTGNGVAGRQIPHALGIAPGMVIVKAASTTSDWYVKHKDLSNNGRLNLTNAFDSSNGNINTFDAATFTVFGGHNCNVSGVTYVAYLFAHDTSADGIIQCGSFTTDGSGNATVNLGWEPQYVMLKASSTTGNWITVDSMRGIPVGSTDAQLYPNLSNAEALASTLDPTATGFNITGLSASQTYVYLAIRRSNKPPTSGTEVFNPTVYTGTNADNRLINTGILTDMAWLRQRNGSGAGYEGFLVGDRLRGNAFLKTASTAAEATVADGLDAQLVSGTEYGNAFSSMTGVWVGNNSGAAEGNANINANTTANNHVALAFKRATGFFDVVTYTGTGVARTVAHNLGVAPELMIVRTRSNTNSWAVYHGNPLGAMYLDLTNAYGAIASIWNNTSPTSSVFTVGTASTTNTNNWTFVAYLFATKAGVSKVGTYTGNGSSQTIDCGFATGARFILIKRTDSTGDWYVYDTARTYPAGNDFRLNPNTTTAEASSTDDVDYAASGFIVNQNATTNLNVTSASYIYLSVA